MECTTGVVYFSTEGARAQTERGLLVPLMDPGTICRTAVCMHNAYWKPHADAAACRLQGHTTQVRRGTLGTLGMICSLGTRAYSTANARLGAGGWGITPQLSLCCARRQVRDERCVSPSQGPANGVTSGALWGAAHAMLLLNHGPDFGSTGLKVRRAYGAFRWTHGAVHTGMPGRRDRHSVLRWRSGELEIREGPDCVTRASRSTAKSAKCLSLSLATCSSDTLLPPPTC